MLNSKTSGTLAVQCNNLGFGSSAGSNSITIKKSDIDALSKQKKVEIAIMAYIVLPIAFKVEKDGDPANKAYEFALPSFGSGTDLLGRSAKLDNETLFTYLDVIKDARFELDTSLLPIAVNPEDPDNKLKLSVDLRKPDGTSVIQKKDLVLSGKGQFSLTGDEIETLLTEYPIDPAQSKIAIEFPKGSLYMRRDMKFGTSVNLGISTDGTIKLDDLKGGN